MEKNHLGIILFCIMSLMTGAVSAQTWTVYKTNNSGIPGNSVWDLAVDSTNTLWVATSDGLGKYDGSNWTTYNFSNTPIPPNSLDDFYTVFVDWDQNVWVGTENGYLYKFDQDTTWTDYSAGSFGDVYAIRQDYTGKMWIGHHFGLKSLDDTTWTDHTGSLPDNYVTSIEVDTDNHIWVGTKNGVGLFDNDSTWVEYTPLNSGITPNNPWIESIRLGFGDDMWIGSRDGIYLFDKDTTWVKYNSSNTPLWDDQVRSVDIDSDSIVWIANDAASMGKYKGGSWSNIFFPSFPNGITFSRVVLVDLLGAKWIGAQDGLARYNSLGAGPIYLNEKEIDLGANSIIGYPNPATQYINFEFQMSSDETVQIYVQNIQGQFIEHVFEGKINEDNFTTKYYVESLPAGIYFAVIQSSKQISYFKFIVTE